MEWIQKWHEILEEYLREKFCHAVEESFSISWVLYRMKVVSGLTSKHGTIVEAILPHLIGEHKHSCVFLFVEAEQERENEFSLCSASLYATLVTPPGSH